MSATQYTTIHRYICIIFQGRIEVCKSWNCDGTISDALALYAWPKVWRWVCTKILEEAYLYH